MGNSDTNNNAKGRSTRSKTSQNILPSSKKPQLNCPSPKKSQPKPPSRKKTQPKPPSPKKSQPKPPSRKKIQPKPSSPKKSQPKLPSRKKIQPKPSSPKKSQPKPPSPKKTQPQPPSIKKLSSKVYTSRNSFNKIASPQVPVTKNTSHKPIRSQRLIDKSLSFQVLGGNKKSQESVTTEADVYEFTFDPTEEPQPQKKKRKKPTVKKQKAVEPKALPTYKRIYDQNISKALSALRKAIKPSQTVESAKVLQIQETCDEVAKCNLQNNKSNADGKKKPVASMCDTGKASVYDLNYPSIRIEDIAADIETSVDHHDNLNYSPVNSPRPQSPAVNSALHPQQNSERVNSDPLNLEADLSFFDDVPVASSSMNMSVRHPLASPWRVEFGSLPIKWHSNTYVKPNMTPAVESSFICTEDYNKKKHVYTNMLTDPNESFPQIVSDTPVLKQTSIMSFIREVAEKQAKKKRGRSVSPSKAMAVEYTKKDFESNMSTAEQTETEKVHNNPVSPEEVSRPIDTSNDTENSKEGKKARKRKNDENCCCDRPSKSPRKQKDKDCTYFGFDDSEDQENVLPSKLKVNSMGRSLRLKARAVLKEINGPSRAALPIAAKSKIVTSSEAVNKVYEGLKSAADAPVFPEMNVESNLTNLEELAADDSQSVHLFEDIEVVHHLKPTRKSYGKPKKVTFHQASDTDTREGFTCQDDNSSFEDDLADLTFEVPDVKEKKKTKKRPKKLMSKKEEKEAEEWAAGFNSMCEEIEEFELMVE